MMEADGGRLGSSAVQFHPKINIYVYSFIEFLSESISKNSMIYTAFVFHTVEVSGYQFLTFLKTSSFMLNTSNS